MKINLDLEIWGKSGGNLGTGRDLPRFRNCAKTRTASKIEAVSFGSHPVKVILIIALSEY
jgi:hypothetical protein